MQALGLNSLTRSMQQQLSHMAFHDVLRPCNSPAAPIPQILFFNGGLSSRSPWHLQENMQSSSWLALPAAYIVVNRLAAASFMLSVEVAIAFLFHVFCLDQLCQDDAAVRAMRCSGPLKPWAVCRHQT